MKKEPKLPSSATSVVMKFSPNYNVSCEVCGNTPTVDMLIISKENGEVITEKSGLCGCCYFGESSCIDPTNW